MIDHNLLRGVGGVYLIHLAQPLAHAKHYLGYAEDIGARFERHCLGQGARILRACNLAKIDYTIEAVWVGASRDYERRMKNRKETHCLCPVCSPDTFLKKAVHYGITPITHRETNRV